MSALRRRVHGTDPLSPEEQRQVDELALEADIADLDAILEAEVNAALEAAAQDTDRLIREYTEQAYDKRILRKMEKMNKQ